MFTKFWKNMKTVYIPWFSNTEDGIFRDGIKWDKIIVQKNIKKVSEQKLIAFLTRYPVSEVFLKLKRRYPSITKEIVEGIIWHLKNFKWFTRDLESTIFFTAQEIENILDEEWCIDIQAHSQWWIVAMISLMLKCCLIKKVREIHLWAPVPNLQIMKNFIKTKEWFYHKKWIFVNENYIRSLDMLEPMDLLWNFLEFLSQNDYKWTVILTISETDNVVDIKNYDTKRYTKYPFVKINILKNWWHNLEFNE